MAWETHRVEEKQMWESVSFSQGMSRIDGHLRTEDKGKKESAQRECDPVDRVFRLLISRTGAESLCCEATQARELCHSRSRKLIFLFCPLLRLSGYTPLLVFVFPWKVVLRIICARHTMQGSDLRKQWLCNNCWVSHTIPPYKNEFERYLVIASCLPFYNPNRFKSPKAKSCSVFVSFLIARQCLETAGALQPHFLAS